VTNEFLISADSDGVKYPTERAAETPALQEVLPPTEDIDLDSSSASEAEG
jgi:hypothetical protein